MSSLNSILPKDAVWFVTGTSSGIGFSLISSILATPGHRIVILSRSPSRIQLPATSNPSNTLLQSIDLTSSSSIEAAFTAALVAFGRIDVVINNAGYSLLGELESITEAASRSLFEINFWAPYIITQHAIRIMREVNPKTGTIGGVIAQVSSSGGYKGVPGLSPYNASKFALEGFTEAVSQEIDPEWNIRFAILEPGGVKTEWAQGNMIVFEQHPAYVGKGLGADRMKEIRSHLGVNFAADADVVSDLIVEVLKGEKGTWDGKELLRLPIGADSYAVVKNATLDVLKQIEEWREISKSTSHCEVEEILRKTGFLKD
jgi:NAD(P)-dependent dehydrogenase (short-subunit alcohol dehydrogenase family)